MSPRRLNFYGHWKRGAQAKRAALARKIEEAHSLALLEDARRTLAALQRDPAACLLVPPSGAPTPGPYGWEVTA